MYRKIRRKLYRLSPFQLIVSYYLIAIVVSVSLLSLPISLQEEAEWTFIDALFTSVSAVSVTGLTTVPTAETFSVPGVFILAFVLQFGGIGVMTLGTFIWMIMGKKIGLKERNLIKTDHNQSNLSGLVNLIKQVLQLIIAIEIIGTIILGTYYLNYYPWQEAYLQGFFGAVSATTNAGFDITGESLKPFANDYFVQFVTIVLLILGSIGFPVLIEIKDFMLSKNPQTYRFSLFTKLTTITFFGLLIYGTVMILLLEMNHFFADKSWHEAFFYALFQSATTKSAGLSTLDMKQLSYPTLFVICGLMFIGASPSSVGGGIRTTTFALNVLFIYSFARGYRSVKIFRREIHELDILKSLVVTIVAIFICFASTVILLVTESFTIMEIIFEVCSAFGTNGLSMGITPYLSNAGKIVIMFLMFVGRVGLLTFLYLIGSNQVEARYHYPKERVIIG
ncbi:TrkH family potassium uptake protein [Bacillus carboniphilus]|uniref:TrkH family potassium uptake protein n=1 Tax=Bacillus carboniphilus TaxID=86663 RepID=A0ABY9JXE9_9BACI|nr:TrkH family potassium uptake protein [Bacillus carboniphilus]WLR43110.1 TrkH family potassium uptake protein [Bacillus carboniphilus]